MKTLQVLTSIDNKLDKLLDRIDKAVPLKEGERGVNSPVKETKVAFQLDTTQAQKALSMLSDTVSNIKGECKELQGDKEHSTKLVSKPKEEQDTSYIDRMTKERDELIDKYHKLSCYLVNHKEELSKEEIRLMNNQYRIMLKYSEILYERISIALNK